jgi:hypothetical protein
MQPDQSEQKSPLPSDGNIARDATESSGRITPGRTRRGMPLWFMTAAAGLVAGSLGGMLGEVVVSSMPLTIEYPSDYASMGGYQKVAVQAMSTGKATRKLEQKKAATAYGLLAAILGISLGLIGGVASGSARSGVFGAVIGGAFGAAAAAGLSFLLVPLFFKFQDPESGLVVLFLTHAGIFAGIGVASGLALGCGLNNQPALGRALFGGLMGALIGTFAFEAVNSIAFPLEQTFEPMPVERLSRVLAHLCVGFFTAVVAGLTVGNTRGVTAEEPAAN